MFAFFENLHIDLNIAIEKRKNFDTMTERDVISVQNIDFRDVAIDKNFEKISKKNVISDSIINFDNAKNDEIKKINFDFEICTEIFDFFACRMRICSYNLMLLSNLIECLQRLHVYFSIRFLIKRISFCCFNNFFVFCLILFFICNSCLRK